MEFEVWQWLPTAIEAHEAQLPARDQACRVGDEDLLLVVTLNRVAVVFDPRALDRGKWLVLRASVEVDAEATRWVPAEDLDWTHSGWNRRASWRGRMAAARIRSRRSDQTER